MPDKLTTSTALFITSIIQQTPSLQKPLSIQCSHNQACSPTAGYPGQNKLDPLLACCFDQCNIFGAHPPISAVRLRASSASNSPPDGLPSLPLSSRGRHVKMAGIYLHIRLSWAMRTYFTIPPFFFFHTHAYRPSSCLSRPLSTSVLFGKLALLLDIIPFFTPYARSSRILFALFRFVIFPFPVVLDRGPFSFHISISLLPCGCLVAVGLDLPVVSPKSRSISALSSKQGCSSCFRSF